jgi:hypothetical protein
VQFPEWLALGLTIFTIAVVFSLTIACLLAIGWVAWMLTDDARTVDYRRRVEDALHCHAQGKSPWLNAVRCEATYATHYALDVLSRRTHTGSHPQS